MENTMENTMGIGTMFLEPEVNREASNYISDNYYEIIANAPKFGVNPDKCEDLVNDVFISIIEAENEGNGFDMGKAREGDIILVSQFVYGRLKGYAKNHKYRTDLVEKRYSADLTKDIDVIASSGSSSDFEAMDSFQKAYAMASTEGDIDAVIEERSIREEIDYCLGFDSIVELSLMAFFKNIDMLADPESDVHKSLFDKLKDAMKVHDEFSEAFKSVIKYSMQNRESFDEIIASM